MFGILEYVSFAIIRLSFVTIGYLHQPWEVFNTFTYIAGLVSPTGEINVWNYILPTLSYKKWLCLTCIHVPSSCYVMN